MSLVCDLSKFILTPLFCEWLDMRDVCCLDTSICNEAVREKFLNLISADTAMFHGFGDRNVSKDGFKWLQQRSLFISSLCVERSLSENVQAKCLSSLVKLKTLHISSDIMSKSKPFIQLLNACALLEDIHVSHGQRINDKVITALADSCHNLKVLSFPCWDNSAPKVSDTAMIKLFQNCRELQVVYLSSFVDVTDAAFQAMTESCNQLHELTLRNIPHMTRASLTNIYTKCDKLTILDIRDCYCGFSDAISQVLRHCVELQHVSLFIDNDYNRNEDEGDDDSDDESTYAAMNAHGTYSDGDLESTSGSSSSSDHGASFPQIKSLKLSSLLLYTWELKWITAACRNVTALTLMDIPAHVLTADGYLSIAVHCKLIRELSLINCTGLNGESLEVIGRSCRELTLCDLSGNQLTQESLYAFLSHCPGLQSLFLSRVSRICFKLAVVERILTTCKSLTSLDLSHNCRASCEPIHVPLETLIGADTTLKELHIANYPRVSEYTLSELRKIQTLTVFMSG